MEREEEHLVPREKALDHAVMRMLLGVVTKTPGLEEWRGALVRPEPLVIYDVNGHLLFYEFSVEKNGKIVGRIKVSASKVLGPAVYTAEIGPRLWDADKATEQAKKIAKEKFKDAEIVSTQLVCYSYPKLGILVVLADPKTKEEVGRIIVDVASYVVVPEVFPEEDTLGIAIWSMYASIPQKDRRDRISRWEEDDRLMEPLKKEAAKRKIDIRKKLSDKELLTIEEALKKGLGLSYKKIDLTLHGQQHCVWCAVATGQMLLKYHNYYYEQNSIVAAMGTVWHKDDCLGGTSYGGFMAGMKSLSRNYLDAVKDNWPTWSEVKSEIDENQPFMSCVPGHARACSGYSRFVVLWKFLVRRNVYIYDPWPPNSNNRFCNPQGGAEYWEDWDATTYWPFVYIRPCKGTMICQE